MIRNGNVELQAREEEIRFLKMQMNEENRSIGLLRGQLPNRRSLEEEQTTLRIQVYIGPARKKNILNCYCSLTHQFKHILKVLKRAIPLKRFFRIPLAEK